MGGGDCFIHVDNVTKAYASHIALRGLSLSIPRQSIYGLLGPNGAGKTTLIRILNQITVPDSGTIRIEGDLLSTRHIAEIGYLPEERGLYKKMEVCDHVLYLAQLKGVPRAEAEERLQFWFNRFEIRGWKNKRIEELSKGMQQKVQFITTVIHNPKTIILDEPFSGFDPVNANIIKDAIKYLRDNGATILLSTHNMASVEELCDHITLINQGEKILEGKVNDIRTQFSNKILEVKINTDKDLKLASWPPILYSLEIIDKDADIYTLRVSLQEGHTTNQVLQSFMTIGQIKSFKEILPSMNDIFIRLIKPQDGNE